jgi:eukaryotic-like serine/threonine-protein kinase
MRICPRCGTHYEHERFCPEDGVPTQEQAAPAGNPADPLLGRVFDGRYRVEARIGEGGMGVVYRATHIALNKTIAVKVLRAEMTRDADAVQRFAQEAQAASSIGHENIVDISDFGRLPDGNAYFVMEYLNGRALSDLIKLGGALPVVDALSILKQVAGALGAAHQRGIVHRDLKPDNIHVLKRGELDNFVKVLDFGIAKVGSNNKLTRTGTVFGTPHYMSPEQAAGQSVDARTDIYALGVIMYEMFAGHVPFDADTFMAVLTKHMFEKPAPLQSPQAGRYLGALERITMRALEKKPDQRYQSMFELIADLDRAAGGQLPVLTEAARPNAALADALEPRSKSEMDLAAVTAPPDLDPSDAPVLPGGRSRTGLLVAAGAGLLLAGLVGFWLLPSRPGGASSVVPPPVLPASQAPLTTQPAQAPAPSHTVEPSGSAEQRGPVELTSAPSGATVLLDGAIIGNTPASLPRPTGRTLELELRAEGYEGERVRVEESSPETVHVTLRRVHAALARPRPSAASQRPASSKPSQQAGASRPSTGRRHPGELVDPWE